MKNRFPKVIPLLILFFLTACAANNLQGTNKKTVPVEDSVKTMFKIINDGNGTKFCIPGDKKIVEIAKDLEEHTKHKGPVITTPEMEEAFIKLYPC